MNALELPAKAVKHMGHALNFFHKCLKKTPDNVFAAHGLALVFAEVRQPSPTHLPLPAHLPPAGQPSWGNRTPAAPRLLNLQAIAADLPPLPFPLLCVEQKNDLDGAYKALSMVREKSPDKPEEVLLNLAHVELAMVQHHDHITTPLLYIFSRVDLAQPSDTPNQWPRDPLQSLSSSHLE